MLLGNTVHEVGQRVFSGFLTGRSELDPGCPWREFNRARRRGRSTDDLPVPKGLVWEDL